jgi:hypothetical protein
MSKKFVQETYGAPDERVIRLSRKQIEQIAQTAEHFKDVDDFCLRVSSGSGIGQTIRLTFDIDLTDVSKW